MARLHINQPTQAEPVERQAARRAESIPGWATWSEAEVLNWIDGNTGSVADLRVAVRAMARMIVALRDAQWPGLRE